MTSRERVIRAVRREWPDRCPRSASFTPYVYEEFRRRTGRDDPQNYFQMDIRYVSFRLPDSLPDRDKWRKTLPAQSQLSNPIFGTFVVPANFYHFWGYVFPLGDAQSVQDIEAYPFADIFQPICHQHLEEDIRRLQEQGYYVAGFAGHIFETAWQLFGLERTLEGFLAEPEMVECLLERLTEYACFIARRLTEAGVDMLQTGDDVAMQTGLMMAPHIWRKFLKPRLARVIATARSLRPDIAVWYHSDGNILSIIDDLIEIGVTVLNPIQPECMDLRLIRDRYGDRLAFWGGIGTQSVLPFGSPDDVKKAVRDVIRLFAPGFILAPTHVIEPDVPWDNIIAFFEAADEFGCYENWGELKSDFL
ncbi:MAG: uroporphyrinogen decarboxylase family protein [Armatimonadetes bacterium]|nr:uroporphyrinogen decarboxylase family protein [Armatimonadota bacterium]MDW8122759.1 uroporphyrinogen decarboxylase family protein [Armatimonadota bacterium]